MFDLEKAIATWREQMTSAGLDAPEVLDELESHLRDDLDAQLRKNSDQQAAFDTATQRLGQAGALRSEFRKAGVPVEPSRIKRFVFTLAGIPQHSVAMNTTSTLALTEPAWATYTKATLFLLPAVFMWMFSEVFVVPKLQHICQLGGVELFSFCQFATTLFNNGLFIGVALLLGLVMLEWKFARWQNYRRASIGLSVFVINAAVLALMTTLVILALVAAPNLVQAAKP